MTDRETIKLALEALDALYINDYSGYEISKHEAHIVDEAITALRQALEMPKTNQCGEVCERATLCYACGVAIGETELKQRTGQCSLTGFCASEGYPIVRVDEHQELADDEIYDAAFYAYSRPGFDRDAFRLWWVDDKPLSIDWNKDELVKFAKNIASLYQSQPKREWVGLTDEEIAEGARQSWVDKQAFESAVWWAEEKLREKNGF